MFSNNWNSSCLLIVYCLSTPLQIFSLILKPVSWGGTWSQMALVLILALHLSSLGKALSLPGPQSPKP